MRLLLDTHALLWWLTRDRALSTSAQAVIADVSNAVFVSAASAWEIVTKYRMGKLSGAAIIAADVEAALAAQGFAPLPITVRHGQAAGALRGPHREPFDRMLIAQTMIERLALVSNEAVFDAYGVARLWRDSVRSDNIYTEDQQDN